MKADLFNFIGNELSRGVSLYIAIASVFAILAIVFLQSGLDKVLDYSGNRAWLEGHFKETMLSGAVGLLLVVILILELIAGLCSALGFFQLLLFDDISFGLVGLTFSSLSLLCLMFGQRIAKDYAGAGGLVPYFLVVLVGFLLVYVF